MPPAAANKWIVFALVATGIFMSTLDSSIVNVALPVIMSDLNVSMSVIEWVVVIYLLTISSLLLTFGRLSDIKGRLWVYYRGFLIFTIGSFCCGISQGVGWLIAARAIQAIGAAMLMACSPALVVDTFSPAERGKALGMVGTVVAAGLTTGPALGGVIINLYSWRGIFYINIPIGIAACMMAQKILKGSSADLTRKESLDWWGAMMLILCFAPLFTAVTRAVDWGYKSYLLWILIGISIGGLIGLVRIESRARYPIFSPSLLRLRLFALPVAAAVVLFACLFIIVFLMPFFLVHSAGFPIEKVGGIMIIPFVFLFIVAPFSGSLSDRIGSQWLCTVGLLLMGLSLFTIALLPPNASFTAIAWRLGLAGIGTAIFIPPNSSTAMGAVSPQYRGIASGTVATARNLGMVMGVSLAGLIFNGVFQRTSGGQSFKAYHQGLEPFFMTAFKAAMYSGFILAIIGAVLAFLRGKENSSHATIDA
ncbi:MAG: MFS transporter [Desulfobacterales bacterium]|nr:MFS transporter [Desulfobacterales bacterium]